MALTMRFSSESLAQLGVSKRYDPTKSAEYRFNGKQGVEIMEISQSDCA
jgi:hypothetical protein